MRDATAFVIGRVIDIVSENFTTRSGDEIRKTMILVKPDAETSPIPVEAWGKVADSFEEEGLAAAMIIAKCGILGRSWEGKDGKTGRAVSVRLRDWTVIDDNGVAPKKTANETPNQEEVPF